MSASKAFATKQPMGVSPDHLATAPPVMTGIFAVMEVPVMRAFAPWDNQSIVLKPGIHAIQAFAISTPAYAKPSRSPTVRNARTECFAALGIAAARENVWLVHHEIAALPVPHVPKGESVMRN